MRFHELTRESKAETYVPNTRLLAHPLYQFWLTPLRRVITRPRPSSLRRLSMPTVPGDVLDVRRVFEELGYRLRTQHRARWLDAHHDVLFAAPCEHIRRLL